MNRRAVVADVSSTHKRKRVGCLSLRGKVNLQKFARFAERPALGSEASGQGAIARLQHASGMFAISAFAGNSAILATVHVYLVFGEINVLHVALLKQYTRYNIIRYICHRTLNGRKNKTKRFTIA